MSSTETLRTRLQPYLPRLTLEWLTEDRAVRHHAVDGSLVFADISGFTKLSEKLAKLGTVGAEEMADAITKCFTDLLGVAYEEDGSLLKFGGDALLLLFSGDDPQEHAARASRAAIGMRKRLRTVGKLVTPGGRVNLRMSVGAHSGRFDFFLVGDSHRELIVTGPGSSRVVEMEGTAVAGEIVVSPEFAANLPAACVGAAKGEGFFLRTAPKSDAPSPVWVLPELSDETLEQSIPVAIRETLLAAIGEPEHRQVSVAFIHFDGTDELLQTKDANEVADQLHELVSVTQAAVEEFGVCFLGSDVDADGGKIILTAGVPRAVGDDEQRMLLTLRKILDAEPAIQIRIGVNKGPVFAGDIGPRFRRTYTVMGDAVNLAARVMAKAARGELLATASVLDPSPTRFQVTELEPFMVKGKAKPVRAWSVGKPVRTRAGAGAQSLPLVGRDPEMAVVREALNAVRGGEFRLVDLVGESGIGKSRLAEGLRAEASDLAKIHTVGEAYRSTTPYIAWREVLREFLEIGWEEVSEVVVDRLRQTVTSVAPELLPWLPLLASAAGAEMEPTPEVRGLGPEFVRTKLHETVLEFLQATVTSPTLFEFENADLIDEASADLIASIVAAQEAKRPWLFLVARRGGTQFPALDAPEVRHLELAPLADVESATLAEAATEEEPVPAHVLRMAIERSAGNPQLLLDLLSAAGSGSRALPDSVEAAAAVRIDSLSPRDRQLLRRSSILGVSFHPRFLDVVLDDDTPRPDHLTWERLAEFFEPEADDYVRFRRVVVRDAAYAGLPYKLRKRLHAAFATHMEAEVEDTDEVVGLLSLQFFLADVPDKAWTYSVRAGQKAQEIYANAESARYYRRAIEAAKKGGVEKEELLGAYEALWQALLYAGLYEDAARVNSEARPLATHDPIRLARLVMKRSAVEESEGRMSNALRWLTRSRRLLADLDSPEALKLIAEIDARYASTLSVQGRYREAIPVAERSIQQGSSLEAESALGQAENILGGALAMLGRPGAIEHWKKALGHFERAKEPGGQAAVLNNLGVGEYNRGNWDQAIRFYRRGQEAGERLGDPYTVAMSKMNIGEVLVGQGNYQEAEVELKGSIRLWKTTRDVYGMAFCLIQLARINAMVGRIDTALELFEQARKHYLDVGASGAVLEVDAWEADARLLAGDSERALEMCGDLIQKLEGGEGVNIFTPFVDRLLGYGLMQSGDLEAAEKTFERSMEGARAREAMHDVALSMLGHARMHRLIGDPDLELEREAGELMGRLGIRAVPAYPIRSSDEAR